MSDIFKIAYTVNNKIEKYYVFMGPNHDLKDIKKLFKANPDNEIFKNVFSSEELIYIKKHNPNVLFTQELIHKDDTIEIIKKKLLIEFEQNISFQEIYLFAQYEEELNTMSVYNNLSQDGKIDINYQRYKQFIFNIENISLDDIEVKDNYDYEDIQELKLEEGKHIINKPVGQRFIVADLLYPFATNPYNAEEYDSMLEMNAEKITSTTNHSLLMNNGNIKDKTIYLCTAEDVLKYAQREKLSEKSTIKIYYPYLMDKSISTLDELYENQAELKQDSINKINDIAFKEKNKSINIFYSIYDRYRDDNKIVDEGISKLNFIIRPDYIFISPLETIFKLLHASKTTPFIKYNPSRNQENIYRLYTNKIDITGKKIPYLNKSEIFKKMRDLAGTRKVSVYIEYEYHDDKCGQTVLPIICVFENDGSININVESKRVLKLDKLETILRESINPVIEIVKQYLEQSGYNIYTFSNLYDKNIEIINIDYDYCYKYDNKIDLSKIMSCVSSVFNVLSDENEVIFMRYIRVENYNEYDVKQMYIHDLDSKGVGIEAIILKLSDTFQIPIDKAEKEVVDFISSQQLIRDHVNNKFKLKNSPGFKTSIRITSSTNLTNIINVSMSGINNMDYLDTIPIYVDSLIRMTQTKDTNEDLQKDVEKTCKDKKLAKEKQFDDYITSAEKAYPDNVQKKIVKDGLLNKIEDASDDEDDGILGLFGDIDEEESEDEVLDEDVDEEEILPGNHSELSSASDDFRDVVVEGGGTSGEKEKKGEKKFDKSFILKRLQGYDKNNDIFVKKK